MIPFKMDGGSGGFGAKPQQAQRSPFGQSFNAPSPQGNAVARALMGMGQGNPLAQQRLQNGAQTMLNRFGSMMPAGRQSYTGQQPTPQPAPMQQPQPQPAPAPAPQQAAQWQQKSQPSQPQGAPPAAQQQWNQQPQNVPMQAAQPSVQSIQRGNQPNGLAPGVRAINPYQMYR